MTEFDCFTDWAWGHIDDYYRNQEDRLIADIQDFSILNFITKCAQEALSDLNPEQQEEMFGFTLEKVTQGELLDSFFFNKIQKEYP